MPQFNLNSQRKRQPRSGVAVVEMAVCLPVLMLIVIATLESSSMIFLQQSLSIAAYEGSRVSLTPGATQGQVKEQCELILNDRDVSGFSVKVTPGNISSLDAGQWIAVEVEAPFSSNSLMGGWLFAQNQLSSTVQMMKERGGSGLAPPTDDPYGGHHHY